MPSRLIYLSQLLMASILIIGIAVAIPITKAPIGIYFLALLLASTFLLIRDTWQNRSILATKEILIDSAIGLALALLFIYLYRIDIPKISLWLDEATDGDAAITDYDITLSTSSNQQPPFAYLFRRIGLMTYGMNAMGLRMPSVVFNGFFIAQMYFTFVFATNKRWLSFLGAVFLGTNTLVQNYSNEARMYSTSLYVFGFILIQLLRDFHRTVMIKWDWPLFAAFVIWFCTISMQPLVLIFSLVFILLIVSAWRKTWQSPSLILASVLATFAATPIIVNIVTMSRAYIRAPHAIGAHIFTTIKADFYYLADFLYGNSVEQILLPGLLILLLMDFVFRRNRSSAELFFSVLAIAFISVTIVAFDLLISWGLYARYMITAIPIIYLVFIMFFNRQFESKPKYGAAILALIVLVSCLGAKIEPRGKISDQGWTNLIPVIDREITSNDKLYFMTFNKIPHWQEEGIFIARYYQTNNVALPSPQLFDWPNFFAGDQLLQDIQSGTTPDKIYFILPMSYPGPIFKINFLRLKSKNASVRIFKNLALVTITVKDSFLNSALFFYEQLSKQMEPGPHWIKAYDTLIGLTALKGDCRRAKKYFELLQTNAIPKNSEAEIRLTIASTRLKLVCRSTKN